MGWSIRSGSSLCAVALCCCLGALTAGSAFAAEKKLTAEETKARALFTEGQRAYDVGEFSKALGLYTDAYKLKPLPGFLFNIAQCHRQLGNFKEASFFYGRFIDNSKPEAPNVELARELLEDAKRRQLERDQKTPELKPVDVPPPPPVLLPADTTPPPPAVTAVADDTPVTKKAWFWGVVGGGVVVVTVVTVVAVSAATSTPSPAPVPASGSLRDIGQP